MSCLRSFLLVLVLVFAQLGAAAHAVEHGLSGGKGLPTHACQLCQIAHAFGSALPPMPALPPLLPPARLVPEGPRLNERSAFPPLPASQRGPPAFS